MLADKEKLTHEVFVISGIQQDFEIPPHEADFKVDGDIGWFPKSGDLLAMIPHMHVRGKSFKMFADQEARTTTLLDVPAYDFNWQHTYVLDNPLPLRDISKIHFEATFDNSTDNPTNPDASEYVTWETKRGKKWPSHFWPLLDL